MLNSIYNAIIASAFGSDREMTINDTSLIHKTYILYYKGELCINSLVHIKCIAKGMEKGALGRLLSHIGIIYNIFATLIGSKLIYLR